MLDVLKKHQNLNLPFYGINQGTVGFDESKQDKIFLIN